MLGALGVALLLTAFGLNASGRLAATSALYLGLNLVGALLAAAASALIPFVPFVVLEGAWAAVALHGLTRRRRAA